MKINLNYLLVGVLAICFYMFLIEGFADDTTKCCTVNNDMIMKSIDQLRQMSDDEKESITDVISWLSERFEQIGPCHEADSENSCNEMSRDCVVRTKRDFRVTTENNPNEGVLFQMPSIDGLGDRGGHRQNLCLRDFGGSG